jgi:hypothetical protein
LISIQVAPENVNFKIEGSELVGDRPLDDALAEFGVMVDSDLFRIDIEDGELQ